MTTERELAAIRTVGTEWQRNGMHRIYLNDLPTWYGLVITSYHTGNIRSATLDGQEISNSEARRICDRLNGRVWFDVSDGRWYGKGLEGTDLDHIVAAAKHALRQSTEA